MKNDTQFILFFFHVLISNASVNAHPTQSPNHHPSNRTSPVLPSTKRLGWVPEPNQNRGTADIMYMCITTILISTWTVQHVDIPSSESGRQQRPSHFAFKLHKLQRTLLALLAPEITSFKSARDFMEARSLGKLVRRYELETWGPTQSAYAVMGGLRYSDGKDTLLLNSSAAMQKFLDRGGVASLQQVSEEDIKDRDKGSWVVNTIACLQVLWFVVQLVCRRTQGLPSSILEITTLGFVVFSLVSFGLWWRKPQDVECHLILEAPAGFQEDQQAMEDCKVGGSSTAAPSSSGQFLTRVVMISAFGGLHFLAWGSNFPTTLERDLWRAACTMMVLLPLCLWFLMRMGIEDELSRLKQGLYYAGAFAYVVCRLFVIVEPFLQFREMPAGVFESIQLPWSKYFPHID